MRRLSFTSLRFRLIVLVLICVVPALAMTIYNSLEDRRLAIVQVRNNLHQASKIAAAQQSQTITNAQQLLFILSKLRRIGGNVPDECRLLLKEIIKSYPLYNNIGVVKSNGQIVCSASPLTTPQKQQVWLQTTIKNRSFTVENYAPQQSDRQAQIVCSHPIFNNRNELKTVVFLTFNSSWLKEITPKIPLPAGATLSVFDRDGKAIARYPEPQNWQVESTLNAPVIKDMLLQGKDIAKVSGVDGSEYLYVPTARYKANNDAYMAAIGISQADPYAHVNRTLRRNLLGLGLVCAIAITIASIGSHLLWIRPLRKLVCATQRIAKGDLSTRVNLSDRYQEISQLAMAIDNMASSLERQLTQIKLAEAEVRKLNQNLEQRVAERTAQLESTNKELEAFAYSVSHDLRAPLRHISGFVEALDRQIKSNRSLGDRKVNRYIDVIQDSTQRMGQLIEALLGLARIGQKQLVYQPVNVRLLVDEAVALVSQHPEVDDRQHIDFTIAELPIVMGDPTLLQQVFSNLIDNAVKFSRFSHPPQINIGCLTDGTIFIQDNGVGFAMEYADKLFAAFQRLHPQKDFPGTGIGLAIVQRIIHRHGGRIWFESQVQQGTTFYIKLPQLCRC
ncbi:sensor histidine kinase [Aliterella atlantica]|uniref:sensor histidine kinase n=1 Tax=Aliterella atlantica TaxID=1827278 RepID=UPI000698927A|nr:sensor histidine kinase [Aliterella atlantica]